MSVWLLMLLVIRAAPPGPDAADADGFEQLASQVGRESDARVAVQAEAFSAQHPLYPNAGRALLLAAQLRSKQGQPDAARALLEQLRLRFPDTPAAYDAALGLAELDVAERHFDDAVRTYGLLATTPPGRWRYQAQLGIQNALSARLRLQLFFGIAGALLALVLFRGDRGMLWPMPEEVKLGLPLAGLLALAGLGQPVEEARAVWVVAGGGAVMLWANAAYFARRPPVGWRRFRELALAVAQGAGLLFCAVVSTGLWDRFVDTLAAGAE